MSSSTSPRSWRRCGAAADTSAPWARRRPRPTDGPDLLEAGVTPDELARLRGPIGLDLGGRSPAETALAIMAEVVAVRHGASGVPMRDRARAVEAEMASLAGAAAAGEPAAASAA